MKRWVLTVLVAALATSVSGGDLESTLSPDRPQDRAILNYLALAEAKTASAADLTELGVLLAATNRLSDAEHWLRMAVKADKHSFAAWYRLGLVQQRQGRSHDAAGTFARALREKPADPYARFMLALTEERCGSQSAAIADYARAYQALPNLANPRYNPLVLDSKLQTEANLRHYQENVAAGAMPVTALDAAAVKAMMETRPAPAAVAAKPAAGAGPANVPQAETIAVPTPTPLPATKPTPPPGAPGGPPPSALFR
jgi:tetratricopeptide (TPR) repeat protein